MRAKRRNRCRSFKRAATTSGVNYGRRVFGLRYCGRATLAFHASLAGVSGRSQTANGRLAAAASFRRAAMATGVPTTCGPLDGLQRFRVVSLHGGPTMVVC